MHTILYGMMAFLLNYALEYRTISFTVNLLRTNSILIYIFKDSYIRFKLQIGAIIVLFFAVIEEFSQYFIVTRTFDIGDILSDFIGVILFSIIKIKG